MTTHDNDIRFLQLTVKDALQIVSQTTDDTRSGLIGLIGKAMYEMLCRLGYITEGATIDTKRKVRKAVWKRTEKPNPYDILDASKPVKEIYGIENLQYIM
jgi:hypothetical protein